MPFGVKIFVICLVAFLLLGGIITIYVDESPNYNFHSQTKSLSNAIGITFKQFIDFYNLNPEAYRWRVDYFRSEFSYHAHGQIYHLYFKNYHDTIKFVKWAVNSAQREKMLQNYATQQAFVECVKKDIQMMQEQSAQEVQNGIKEMEKVKW